MRRCTLARATRVRFATSAIRRALTADAVLRWLSRYSAAVPTPPETAAHTGGRGVGALTAALKAMQTTAAAQLRTEL